MGIRDRADQPPNGWDAAAPLTEKQARAVAAYWGNRFAFVESYREQLRTIRSQAPEKWRKFNRDIDYSLAAGEVLVLLLIRHGRCEQYDNASIRAAVDEVDQAIAATGRFPP